MEVGKRKEERVTNEQKTLRESRQKVEGKRLDVCVLGVLVEGD